MRIAKSDDLKSFGDPVIQETPQDYPTGIELITSTVHELIGASVNGTSRMPVLVSMTRIGVEGAKP